MPIYGILGSYSTPKTPKYSPQLPALTASVLVPALSLSVGVDSGSTIPVSFSGGWGTITIQSISPSLPTGLSFNTSTGAITGTPTGTSASTSYTVTATDAASQQATGTFTIAITAPALVTTYPGATTFDYTQGVAITSVTPVQASGGVGTITYSISPSLPTGLSLNTSSGLLSGNPADALSATVFTITATDSLTPTPQTSSKTITISVTSSVSYMNVVISSPGSTAQYIDNNGTPAPAPTATWRVVTCPSSGTFSVPTLGSNPTVNTIKILGFSGGAGGGGASPSGAGGGGGAGAYVSSDYEITSTGPSTFVIGAGGAGGAVGPVGARGTNGQPTYFSGPQGTVEAVGGGGGGAGGNPNAGGLADGSGGGSGGGGGTTPTGGGWYGVNQGGGDGGVGAASGISPALAFNAAAGAGGGGSGGNDGGWGNAGGGNPASPTAFPALIPKAQGVYGQGGNGGAGISLALTLPPGATFPVGTWGGGGGGGSHVSAPGAVIARPVPTGGPYNAAAYVNPSNITRGNGGTNGGQGGYYINKAPATPTILGTVTGATNIGGGGGGSGGGGTGGAGYQGKMVIAYRINA